MLEPISKMAVIADTDPRSSIGVSETRYRHKPAGQTGFVEGRFRQAQPDNEN
jgi:hypothetical protein